jgi:hypothetical protein
VTTHTPTMPPMTFNLKFLFSIIRSSSIILSSMGGLLSASTWTVFVYYYLFIAYINSNYFFTYSFVGSKVRV